MVKIKEGSKIPDFTMSDDKGKEISSKDLRGKKTVMFFYCKDDTPGCTKESIDFTKNLNKFKAKGADVVGVCIGTVDSHKKFKDKYDLGMSLLVDDDAKVSKKFGVWKEKNFMGKKYMGIERTTFVIDEKGKIAKIFPKVSPEGHAKEVLEVL